MNTYKVKQEDLIGELEGFPIEIVQKMVDEQIKQGHNPNVEVFKKCKCAMGDGFSWEESEDGVDFWESVIMNKEFNTFFEKYPKQNNENAFYKYYVSGVSIINKNASLSILIEKGGRDTFELTMNEKANHLYYIGKNEEIKYCVWENRDLLEEAGYIELKGFPETVEYNGKKYIKSEFEMAINHLKEVE